MKSTAQWVSFWSLMAWLCLGMATKAGATDIVNNLAGADVNGEMFYNLTSSKLAAQAFQTDNQNYTLNSLVVKLADFVGTSTAQISLRADNGGVPGAVIETLGNISISGPTSVDYTKNSTIHPILARNTKYWVVIKYIGGDFDWRVTSSTGGNGSGVMSQDDLVSMDDGGAWAGGTTQNYFLAVNGTVIVPEIVVTGNGVSIVSGDSTPSGSDFTDFGSQAIITGTVSRSFTVQNSGTDVLTLGTVNFSGAAAGDFTIVAAPAATVGVGENTSFTVRFDPSATGLRNATLSLPNNDANENPFTFALQGTGTGAGSLDVLNTAAGGGFVSALTMQRDGRIVLGGAFTTVGGVARNRIARLNADGALDTSYNPDASFYIASAVAQADGKIVIGGQFNRVGGAIRNCIARLNTDGSVEAGFDPNVDTGIDCLAMQADGKIVLCGLFTTVGGVTRNYIARLNADGSLDANFNPNVNDIVYTVFVQADGKILLGGQFTAVGGTPRNYIARLNADGSLDTNFNPGADSFVDCMAVQADGRILVGGQFTTLGGVARNRLARLNADGTPDLGFDPGANDKIYSLALQADGKMLLGGLFTTAGGGPRNRVARLNADGTLDAGFNPDMDAQVYGVTLQGDGLILVGGNFSTVGGVARSRLARLTNDAAAQTLSAPDATQVLWTRSGATPEVTQVTFENSTDGGSTWTPLGAGTRVGTTANWQLTGLALTGSGQIRALGRTVGGYLNGSSGLVETVGTYSGFPAPEIAITGNGVNISKGDLTPSTSDFTDFGSQAVAAGTVSRTFTVLNNGAAVLKLGNITINGAAAGDFTVITAPASTVAMGGSTTFTVRFDPSVAGLRPATLSLPNDDADENPFTFAVQGAGSGLGSPDTFNATVVGSPLDAFVVQPDGKTIVADTFSSILGVARNNIARLNADNTLDTGFNPNANANIYSAALQADGKIVIGGAFTTVAGVPCNRLARLKADGTLDPGFSVNLNGAVYAVAIQSDGKILISGTFTTVGVTTRNRIARLNADGTLDTNFNPNASGTCYTMALQPDGKIVLGGTFTTVGGTTRNNLARLKADGTLDTAFNPNASSTVNCVALQADGKLLVGGTFTTIVGTTRNRLARLNADGTLDTGFNPNVNEAVYSLALQADGRIVLGGFFTSVGGTTRNRAARINADGTLDANFNPDTNNTVFGVALQADGQVLIGGSFTTAGGVTRSRFARLINEAAAQTLTIPDATQLLWSRSGTTPEVEQVTFERSTDGGTTWTLLGAGTRVANTANWQLTGLTLGGTGQVRARGRTSGGYNNSSSGLVETTGSYSGLILPDITLTLLRTGNTVDLSWPVAGAEGLQLQSVTSLAGTPVWTVEAATITTNGGYYHVLLPANTGNRFFRLATVPQ